MTGKKEVSDNITSSDDIMAGENSTFATRLASVSSLEYRVKANKDLVGEPLNPGIFDESTGKVVPTPSIKEVNDKVYKELEAKYKLINADITKKSQKFTAADSAHHEVSVKYVAAIKEPKKTLDAVKVNYDALNEKQHLTEENKIDLMGQLNAVDVAVFKMDKEFDAAIEADVKTVAVDAMNSKSAPKKA